MSGPRGTVTAPIIFQSAMNLALCVHRKTRCSHPQAWIGCVRKFRRNVCQHHFCAICGDSAQEVASSTQTQFAPAFLTITIRDLSARLYTRLAPPRHPREQNPRGGFRLRALAALQLRAWLIRKGPGGPGGAPGVAPCGDIYFSCTKATLGHSATLRWRGAAENTPQTPRLRLWENTENSCVAALE